MLKYRHLSKRNECSGRRSINKGDNKVDFSFCHKNMPVATYGICISSSNGNTADTFVTSTILTASTQSEADLK